MSRTSEAADAAIFKRQEALVNSSDGQAEREAIEDAMRVLRFIQTKDPDWSKLSHADWNKSKLPDAMAHLTRYQNLR